MSDSNTNSSDDGSDYTPNFGPPNPDRAHGVPPPPPPVPVTSGPRMAGYATAGRDTKSTAALALGGSGLILGLFCGLFGIPLGIAAIIFGIQGRRSSQALGRPTGMATTGLVLGVVTLVVVVAFWVILGINSTS